MGTKRNQKLDTLRGIWIISIFVCHWSLLYGIEGFQGEVFSNGGGYGVVGFFTLSGFLVWKKNCNDFAMISVKKMIIFALSKIGKLYLLHLLCMIPFLFSDFPIILELISSGDKAWQNYVIEYGLNILLLQSLFPSVGSVNGVSWFLSCIFIIYLLTPILIRLHKLFFKYKESNIILLCVYLGILLWFNFFQWAYDNPFLRIFHYMAGMVFANIAEKKSDEKKHYKCMVATGVVLSVFTFIVNLGTIEIIIETVAVGALIMGLVGTDEIKHEKKESLNLLPYVGLHSGKIFLIHYPIISILGDKIKNVYYNGRMIEAVVQGLIMLILTFFISAIFSNVQKRMNPILFKKLFMRR